MPDGQETDQNFDAVRRACQLASCFLWFAALLLPIAVTPQHVDEFGSSAYGWEGALLALLFPLLLIRGGISPHPNILQTAEIIAVSGIIPCSGLLFLIGRSQRFMAMRSFSSILAVFITAGLASSYFVIRNDKYRTLYGYYIWLGAVLLFTLSELILWRNRRTVSGSA